ncbi:RlpA-like double-psi beta-barrel-protein domain-containing protein-containing protein, partial [Mycena polygramma]
AIFYSPNGTVGACGNAIQNTDFAVALNTADFVNGASCGEKLTVSFNGKNVTASVQDSCTNCAAGDFKLSAPAFEALTGSQSTKSVKVVW